MRIPQNTVELFNPGKTPVWANDNLVYALTKGVLHRFPTMFQAQFPMMENYTSGRSFECAMVNSFKELDWLRS